MDHGHGMGGMGGMGPTPSASMTMPMQRKRKGMMMHMSFYWGHEAEILFDGWPGSSVGMYVVSIVIIFLLALLVEYLSRARIVSRMTKNNNVVSGVLLTFLHGLRMGLAYFVMLAVMSFNVGVFIAAILGHALGFMLFGTRVFGSGSDQDGHGNNKGSDLPPMSC